MADKLHLATLWLAAGLSLVGRAMAAEPADPFLWLEQVDSPRAMAWVRAENERTLKPLLADPHYQIFADQAVAIAEASDRVPAPEFLAGAIYNFWQDSAHPQGIWRVATPEDYPNAAPHWRTMMDIDALGREEHHTWVWKGDICDHPTDSRCLISLSEGGEDAVTTREFDMVTGHFVPDGFSIPHAKQVADWETADSLLVGTDWGPGSMTESGYPFVIKRLLRGQKLAQAQEVFRGAAHDEGVQVNMYADGQGHRMMILQRELDFFRSQDFEMTPAGVRKLNLPERADVEGLVHNQLIVRLNQDMDGTPRLSSGSLVSLDMAHPDSRPVLVWAPNGQQSIDAVSVTANTIVASVLDRVRGRAMVFTQSAGGWAARALTLPDNASVGISATTSRTDQVAWQVTGFLQPTSLYLADATGGAAPAKIKFVPAKFDASRDTVDQYEAISSDGTKIPYFVVHRADMKADGSHPTLLTAYGGFQISETPAYDAVIGKEWLEPGRVFVVANIRGGGEFGPAWHEAGLKTKRQVIYDDFAAVGRDLVARRITSPAHLGIRGGSNGGLLMGVEFEQHPDLWNAVVIDVPLLDMLRYEKIAAGASWAGEYGSVANPAERAFLASISPYNNLRAGVHYPVPFIFTTTRDDRVGPVHARKFAARMEAMGLPFYYRESVEGGHAAGANLREAAEEKALEVTYLRQRLDGGAP